LQLPVGNLSEFCYKIATFYPATCCFATDVDGSTAVSTWYQSISQTIDRAKLKSM